ncbi:MAG TPA: hypothetical protein VKY74_23800 [Chloroflexia bacterium]|nr:hypothetical protein [Chloroflexia bacterium]
MPPIEDEITALLTSIQGTLAAIAPLRQRAEEASAGLAQVEQEYAAHVGAANAQAAQVQAAIDGLLARLRRRPAPLPLPALAPPVEVAPLPLVIDRTPTPTLVATPVADLRAAQKLKLVDHIWNFVGAEQRVVRQTINGLLADQRCEIGDILELLPWGPVWTAPEDAWETPAAQQVRLQEWLGALEKRLAAWQQKVRELERHPNYELWLVRKTSRRAHWLAFLDDLAAQQTAKNADLAHKLAGLEAQWQAHQAEEEAADA